MVFARTAMVLAGSLILAGCGSSKEAELEKQLAEAQATAAREAQARQAAENQLAAMRNSNQSAELADFYGSGDAPQDSSEDQMTDEEALSYHKAPPQVLGEGG